MANVAPEPVPVGEAFDEVLWQPRVLEDHASACLGPFLVYESQSGSATASESAFADLSAIAESGSQEERGSVGCS